MYAFHRLKKPLILRHPEQVLARPVGLIRQFQSKKFWALLRVEENPRGKLPGIGCKGWNTSHTQPRVGSQTQAIAVRGERVTTAPPSLKTNISIFMQFLLLKYNQIILPSPPFGVRPVISDNLMAVLVSASEVKVSPCWVTFMVSGVFQRGQLFC